MLENGRKTKLAILATAALLMGIGAVAPVFAWSSSLNTCLGNYTSSTYPNPCPTTTPSYPAGSVVYDTAKVYLTSNGPSYGSVTFLVAQGTCGDHSTGSSTGVTGSSQSVTGSGTTYYNAHVTITAAGSYVWLVSYGGGGYPSQSTCEPFTITVSPPTVPQFPLGMALLMALAIPALFLVRGRFASKTTSSPI